MAETVAEARGQAATAMDAIVAAVKETVSRTRTSRPCLSTSAQYEYPEVEENGRRVRKQTLVGYTITNTARIKISDVTP